jgi:hypothetical protein
LIVIGVATQHATKGKNERKSGNQLLNLFFFVNSLAAFLWLVGKQMATIIVTPHPL